jgi:hypothetical protein
MRRRRRIIFLLLSPLLSLGILGVLFAERETLAKPSDFDGFHKQVAQEIWSLPSDIGPWMAKEADVPKEAVKLLRPNALRSMEFWNQNPWKLGWAANYTVVQCRDTGDMLGHYPPICYPAFGNKQEDAQPRSLAVSGKNIDGMEYRFARVINNQRVVTTVYNFMVLPGRGIVRDMDSLAKAADNYQQRYYGAAQFQVVFREVAGNELSQAQKDDVFVELMTPSLGLIDLISRGDLK